MQYLIFAILFAGVAIVLAYMSKWEAIPAAFLSLLSGFFGRVASVSAASLIFWGVAAVVVLALWFMLPRHVVASRRGMPFLCTGALAGTVVGMVFNTSAGIILGAAVGIFLAALVMGRSAVGRDLEYPTKKYFNYVLAKGFPVLVTFAILGVLFVGILAPHTSNI